MSANEPRAALVLDDIHAALLQRQYEALPELAKTLEAALEERPQNLSAASLALIRSKAERNATTLNAVQRGIKSAIRRIAEIRSVSRGMVTYDKSGRKEETAATGLAQRL